MWDTTNVANLLRHRRSRRFYARFALNGKRKIVALKTDKLSIAKIRLHQKLAEVEGRRLSGPRMESGDATMGDLIAKYRQRFEASSSLSSGGKRAREFALKRLERTWPELDRLRPSAITKDSIQAWSHRIHSNLVQPVPQGSQSRRIGYSANSVNQAVDALRRLLILAVESGALHSNPFDAMKGSDATPRKKVRTQRRPLPEPGSDAVLFAKLSAPRLPDDLPAPLAERIRSDAHDVNEFVRGLAFTGMRRGEAAKFTWEDVRGDMIAVRGTKSDTSDRQVPVIPPMRALLHEMRARREANGWTLTGPVFRVSECQKSLDRACREAGISRLRHHDLRHLFATRCIQAGVDIPTVAHWLGHADGGALAMKTYGHLQIGHSVQAAKLVTFGASGEKVVVADAVAFSRAGG